MVSVLDFKREVGLWHSILTVRLLSMFVSDKFHVLLHIQLLINCFAQASTPDLLTKNIIYLQSVYNGMHVIFVPGCVLKTNPAMWLQVVTKQRGKRCPGGVVWVW